MDNDAPTPVIIPHIYIRQLLMRHEMGPQDSDGDHNGSGSNTDPEEDEGPEDILSAARRRWNPAPAPPLPPTPAAPLDKKTKKLEKHRRARREKREAMRADAPEFKPPKAVVRVRARQTSTLSLPRLRFSQMPLPAASTGWMGLRKPPQLPFEPEARAYGLEEAKAIPGMQYLEWDGCATFVISLNLASLYAANPGPSSMGIDTCLGFLLATLAMITGIVTSQPQPPTSWRRQPPACTTMSSTVFATENTERRNGTARR